MTATAAVRSTPSATKGNAPMHALRDTWLILRRSLILTLRTPTWLIFGLVQPILYLVLFGLRIDPAGAAVTIGLVALIGLALSPLSYSAALVLKSEDALAPVVNFVALPLLLLSGILLPLALAPSWLRFLSTLNPLTHAADAARALFNGDWGNPEIAIGTAIVSALAVFAVWLASRALGRALSRAFHH